jgi:hypothetical protein
MTPSARVTRIVAVLGVLASVAGCDGKVIHLDNPCAGAPVPASQVLWIGDSWVTIPGNQVTSVQTLAQQAGAIGAGDMYTVKAANGAVISQIATQYTMQEATSTKAKVLIMDGGTLDTIMSNGSSASVTAVGATFHQLLGTIAADGTVTDIIYFLVPELPDVPGVAALRPVLQQECHASAVRCHFIDLTPLWSGHPEYTNSNGIFPTAAGAEVIASQIWSTMQAACIAQ